MSALRAVLIAAGAWLLCAGAAAQDMLDACAAQAPAGTRGIVALEAACPGIEAALSASSLSANLPVAWRESLDASALRDLVALEQRYLQPPSPAPDRTDLRAILDQLASEQIEPRRSWWDAVKDWLRSWFATRDPVSGSWLDDLLERLGQSRHLVQVFTYVLLAIVVVAALAFIVNELRLAGVLTRRSRPRESTGFIAPATAPGATEDLDDLDAAPAMDQPAILLRLLVARLMARDLLRAERSLTHHELVTRVTLPDAGSQQRFAGVARLAERILYGRGTPDSAQAQQVVTEGRRLLLQLQASGKASP